MGDQGDAGAAAGDIVPAGYGVIEVRVAELRQLFNAIDPSPFHERDLDPKAESFIVGWGSDLPPNVPLALVVHLERAAGTEHEAGALAAAIHEYFGRRATETRRSLRELFRRGRLSLVIALAFLAVALAIGAQVGRHFPDSQVAEFVREGVLIVGWVAMWRPIEIFLYDWWPIRAEGRLFQRLAVMPVRLEYRRNAPADAWRTDWPAASALLGTPAAAAAGVERPGPL
jgi:hypothetical protein